MSIPTSQNPFLPEPTGFPTTYATDATLSFVDGSRTFTITPVLSPFTFNVQGTLFSRRVAASTVIPNTEGIHIVYFDGAGDLQSALASSIDFSSFLYLNAWVTSIYWSVAQAKHLYFAEERHGIIMDGETHANLHLTQGTKWLSGLAGGDFTPDAGGIASDAAGQLSLTNGSIRDEDLTITIVDGSPQTLAFPAELPVFYRDGATDWRMDVATKFPVKSFSGGSGLLAWNELTGGVWQQTEVANNQFVLAHVWATNDIEHPVIAVQGQATYGSVISAREGAATEINALITAGLPFEEFTPLGSVIYQTSTTYTGSTVLARVRTTDEGANYVDFRGFRLSSTGSVSDHGNLAGLTDDDHPQYALLAGRAGDRLVLADDATTPPLNMTERSAPPSTGVGVGDMYLDDGTLWNSGAGVPGLRRLASTGPDVWEDVGVSSSALTVAQTVYVAKHGDDANSGRSLDQALLTHAAAETLVGTLTPSATNRIVVLTYPGRYTITSELVLTDDYVSWIGVGARGSVEIYVNTAIDVLDMANRTGVELRNMRFSADTNAGAFAVFKMTNLTDCQIVNCRFSHLAAGQRYAEISSSPTSTVEVYDSMFDLPTPYTDRILYLSGNTLVHGCQMIGVTEHTGAGSLHMEGCDLTSAHTTLRTLQLSAVTAGQEQLVTGCRVTNTAATGSAVYVRRTARILGCSLISGASGWDIVGEGEAYPIEVSGTTMSVGMDNDVRLLSGVHRYATAGACDFHKTLQEAIAACGTYDMQVLVEADVTVSAAIVIQASAKIVIDGGADHHSITSSATNSLQFSGAGAQCTVRNLTIADGQISQSAIAVKLMIENCLIQRRIDLSGGDADSKLVISNSDVVNGDTNGVAVAVDDVNPVVLVVNGSYLKGDGTGVSLSNGSDNPNISCYDSTFLPGDTDPNASPFSNPSVGGIAIVVCHCRLNVDLPANYTNDIATPYNVVDVDVFNIPQTRSW